MKLQTKSFILLLLLTVIADSRTFAQDYFSFIKILDDSWRAIDVRQDNEYTSTGYEQGKFFCNPLLLDEKPLDYDAFSLRSKGELTVIKGAAITGQIIQVPFLVYLRRSGDKVIIPGKDGAGPGKTKIEISEILKHAKPGDELVIEPVRKEDGLAKRILKLLGSGC